MAIIFHFEIVILFTNFNFGHCDIKLSLWFFRIEIKN